MPPPDGGYPGANTAEGDNALLNLTSGINNTAVGANALTHNTTGGYNVGIGSGALASNTTGNFNMAIGTQALTNNTANYNLAIGFRVGFMNTTGNHLTGIGAGALQNNTTGSFNTAIGADALGNNTTGNGNTATGSGALLHGSGSSNTANGSQALNNNTADGNTAIGYQALLSNTIGLDNTAVGVEALYLNNGSNNIALGYHAGHNVGVYPEFPGYNDIEIGNAGDSYDSNTIRIGDVQTATFIAGIYNVNESGTMLPVYINSDGRLGTQAPSSSRRFKKEIKPMDKTSEAILSLKPVTFHYKSDKTDTPQFGLIAEEVAQVNPDLVVRDANGEIYTVRYDTVNAMLLNEFLKEHSEVEKQETTISQLRSTVAQQQKDFQATVTQLTRRLDEQASQIQKVSAQLAAASPSHGGLEVNGQAPHVVSNNQ